MLAIFYSDINRNVRPGTAGCWVGGYLNILSQFLIPDRPNNCPSLQVSHLTSYIISHQLLKPQTEEHFYCLRKLGKKKVRMDLIPHIIIVNSLRPINHPKVCQLVLAPDQGSQVVLNVVVTRGGIKSIIFVVPDVLPVLHVVVVYSVSKLSTPSVLYKLLLDFITSSAQPLRMFQFEQ